MKRNLPVLLAFAAAAVALVAAGILIWRSSQGPVLPTPQYTARPSASPAPTSSAAPTPAPTLAPDDGGLPQDSLFVTEARKNYESGSLSLQIPRLDVDAPVLDGTDENTLLQGLGLYDYAQLPGETGGNVSIAGHRNWVRNGQITDDVPFYYLDTLTDGDFLYLTDETHIYQYLWEKSYVVEPSDWSPIYCHGYSTLTLTTCTPIGVSDHRLIIQARLIRVLDNDGTFSYPAGTAEEAQSLAATTPQPAETTAVVP